MQQSPIFARTYDLVLWLIPRTTKFPREQRFVLGKAVQETVLSFQEALIEAALSGDRGRRKALSQADVALAKLRFYLRLCQDLTIITPRQYHHVADVMGPLSLLPVTAITPCHPLSSSRKRGGSGDPVSAPVFYGFPLSRLCEN